MAYKRLRRPRITVARELHREHILLLSDEPLPKDVDKEGIFRYLHASGNDTQQRRLWQNYEEIVALRWIVDQPGTRPRLWWKFSAPELRRIVSGRGEPVDLDLCNAEFGMPKKWKWIDPRDPPTFEAQSVYLRRHKLWIANEARRVRNRSPEPLPREFWPPEALQALKETNE